MIIDVLELREREEPLVVERVFQPAEIAYRNTVSRLEHPLSVQARVEALSSGDVRIGGRIQTTLTFNCCRCLKEFEKRLEKSFEQLYAPQPVTGADAEIELRAADLNVGFFRDFKIDFTAALVEQLVLEVPMKPICSPNCQGLCAQCGADLNQGACDCPPRPPDPRWGPLADLKRKLTES